MNCIIFLRLFTLMNVLLFHTIPSITIVLIFCVLKYWHVVSLNIVIKRAKEVQLNSNIYKYQFCGKRVHLAMYFNDQHETYYWSTHNERFSLIRICRYPLEIDFRLHCNFERDEWSMKHYTIYCNYLCMPCSVQPLKRHVNIRNWLISLPLE